MSIIFLSFLLMSSPLQGHPSLIQNSGNLKRYSVTIRVVRPVWRKQPSLDEVKRGRGKYIAILSSIFHPKDLNSDAELLQKLNKHNTEFKFERFLNKTSFTLQADTVWSSPKDFSLNDFRFALVQNNIELLNITTPVTGPIVTLGKPDATSQSQFPQYSKQFPPNVRQQIEAQGKVILTRTAVLNSLVEGKKREYLKLLGGPYIIEKNATTCITYSLNVYWTNNRLVFNPSDVILLTISDAK